MTTKKIKYSEIFGGNQGDKPTFQGEGHYAGHPSVWVRFFGCNLNCPGFGQKNPCDPSSYEFDYPNFDFSSIKSMDEVPMIKFGCDSAYSWAAKFKHLAPSGTIDEIVMELEKRLAGGTFRHPKSGQDCHLVFTGGEPMIKGNQKAIAEILRVFHDKKNEPKNITIETNATQPLIKDFEDCFDLRSVFYEEELAQDERAYVRWKLFWSCSPKLYVSGEAWADTIKPEVVKQYANISNHGQLKYVADGSQRCWDEVERATDLYRNEGVYWPVWIMPCSATKEGQEKRQKEIAYEALRRGYNFAARTHCWVFGNEMGT